MVYTEDSTDSFSTEPPFISANIGIVKAKIVKIGVPEHQSTVLKDRLLSLSLSIKNKWLYKLP